MIHPVAGNAATLPNIAFLIVAITISIGLSNKPRSGLAGLGDASVHMAGSSLR